MPRSPSYPWILLLGTAVGAMAPAACRDKSDKSATVEVGASGASGAASTTSTPPDFEDEARAVCLFSPAGETPVDKMLARLQEAARKNPNKIDHWIELGRTWVRKAREAADPGLYVNANRCADVALELKPEFPLALGLRALVLVNEHRFAEARDLAKRILAKAPNDLLALGTLSDALVELGDYPGAVAAAQQMVDLKPNLPSYSRASYLRWLHGDNDAAKRIGRLAIDAGRNSRDREPMAWQIVQVALLFWHDGDYEGAEAGFDMALETFADFPPALVGKGRVALARKDPKKAAELLAKAYALSPLIETAWLLGDARQAAGDAAGAQEIHDKLVKEGRRIDKLTTALFLATKGRDVDQALVLVEEERTTRGGVYVDDAYAWALFRAGKLTEARAAIDRARRLGTRDARILYHAGAIHKATGDVDGGLKLVREALAQNPEFDVTAASEARALVAGK